MWHTVNLHVKTFLILKILNLSLFLKYNLIYEDRNVGLVLPMLNVYTYLSKFYQHIIFNGRFRQKLHSPDF